MAFKVTFIFYNNFTAYSWSPAIQALSAYIKKHCECEAELFHINDRYGITCEPQAIIERLKISNPNLIAFTSTSFGYTQVDELAGLIKKEFPKLLVILGGVHATLKSEDLKDSNFDGFCIGEGEKPLSKLINALKTGGDYLKTPSFHFKTNGSIIENPLEPYEKSLDDLPSYDWDIFDTPRLLELRNGWISLSVSRGCPFNCNFCINHRLKRLLGADGYVRQKSVKKTIAELLNLIHRFKIKVFNFDDDILIFNKDWTQDFLSQYKREIYDKHKVKFKIEARADIINEAAISSLREAGCQEIQLGVETGNPYLRNFVLNKSISDEQIIAAFDACHRYKINTLAFIMLGIPQETEATVTDTVRLLSKIRPYLIRPSFIFPIYGTDFYNYCKENNLLKEGLDKYKTYLWTEGVPIILKEISEEVLMRYMVLLPWYINAEMGLGEYQELIRKYTRGLWLSDARQRTTMFNKVFKEDSRESRELARRKIPHYHYYNQELSYLRYNSFSEFAKEGG